MSKLMRSLLFVVMIGILLILGKLYLEPDILANAWKMLVERPGLFLYFVGGYSAAFYLRAAAWHFLLIQENIPFRKLFNYNIISLFLNHLLPSKVGDIAKILLLNRTGVSWERSTASVVYSRLLDMLSLLVILIFCIFLSYRHLLLKWQLALIPAGIAGITAAALLVFTRVRFSRFLKGKLVEIINKLQTALRDVPPKLLGIALVLTLPSWLLETVVLWVAAEAFGLHLTVPAAITVTAFTIMGQVFHFAPGGLGTYESSMSFALALYGVNARLGFSVALMTHGLKFLYSFGAGGLALWLESVGLTELLRCSKPEKGGEGAK